MTSRVETPLAVSSHARRKVTGVYWALYELGEEALADDSCWFELMAFRASVAAIFVGTVSHLLDIALTCFWVRLDTTSDMG